MANYPYLDANGNIINNAPTSITGDVTITGDLTVSGTGTIGAVPLNNRIYGSHTFGAVADMVDAYVFTCDVAMTLVSASCVFVTTESSGTLGIMLERCQGTEAVGSGDDLLSAAFDGTATAATVQNATLLETAVVDFSAGNRLAVDFTGDTAGELASVTITWAFELT